MLRTVGLEPYTTLKHRTEVINKLKRMYEQVKIEIMPEHIYYIASVRKESNINLI